MMEKVVDRRKWGASVSSLRYDARLMPVTMQQQTS